MLTKDITIQNKFGLHTRAAAKLVALASTFESRIQLQNNDKLADCKSIMAVILLGGSKGITLKLIIDGPDESKAEESINKLFTDKFGEPE